MAKQPVAPKSCPKFDNCSAVICPLDADWTHRNHRQGERICYYLRELVKPDGSKHVQGTLSTTLLQLIGEEQPKIDAQYGPIRRRLKRHAQTPSTWNRQRNLRGQRDAG